MTANIKMMFRQVRAVENQWDLQRIFWRKNTRDDLKEYWLTITTYGLNSAGYNADRAMFKCTVDYAKDFPIASRVIKNLSRSCRDMEERQV